VHALRETMGEQLLVGPEVVEQSVVAGQSGLDRGSVDREDYYTFAASVSGCMKNVVVVDVLLLLDWVLYPAGAEYWMLFGAWAETKGRSKAPSSSRGVKRIFGVVNCENE
jgi:hypothetical protein